MFTPLPLPRLRMLSLAAVLALSCLGCRDSITQPRLRTPDGAAKLAQIITCTIDIPANHVSCRDARDTAAARGASRAVIPEPRFLELMPGTGSYSAADSTYRLPVRLRNIGRYDYLGTPDGAQVTGMKLFLAEPPVDGAPVNHDGRLRFTGESQAYWAFPQMLALGEYTPARELWFKVAPPSRSLTLTFSIFTAIPGEFRVPAVAPDSVPRAVYDVIYDSANWVTDDPRITGPIPRNIILLHFRRSATQEERQAALDLVGARVVGGARVLQDGFYVAQIADDGTADPLFAAVERLRTLPQISSASPYPLNTGPHWLRPEDGPGWRRTDWGVDPDSAAGENWALEAINAPRAWGCEIGDDSAQVAVIDDGEHGEAVRAILGAPGDDGAGMTGVMWRSKLKFYDYHQPSATNRQDIIQQVIALTVAAREGAAAVNMSLGLNWDSTGTPPDPTSARDRARAQAFTDVIYGALDDMEAAGLKNLLVLSAGNDRSDARFAGYPAVVDSARFAGRVIVVAASNIRGELWTEPGARFRGSNHGPRVSVIAPGVRVTAITSRRTTGWTGTSFAAPLVTGIAGLLKSFDPGLTPEDLKRLILDGARRGGRTVGDYPLANAYESLRAAAERPGAPLCGNRVWLEGDAVHARRVAGGVEQVERLAGVGREADYLQVLHGGRQLYLQDRDEPENGGWRFLSWRPAAPHWARDSVPEDSAYARLNVYGPTWNSLGGLSHDGDSLAYVVQTAAGAEVWVRALAGGTPRRIGPTLPMPSTVAVGDTACAVFARVEQISPAGGASEGCRTPVVPSTVVASEVWSPAWPPGGERVLVAVSERTSESGATGSPYTCLSGTTTTDSVTHRVTYTCRNHETRSRTTRSTIYSIPLRGGATTTHTESAVRFLNLAVADAGGEFVVQRETGDRTITYSYEQRGDTLATRHASSGPGTSCATQFRSLAGQSVLFQRPKCGYAEFSFAPLRAAPHR